MYNITLIFLPESEHRDITTLSCNTKKEAHLEWLNQVSRFKSINIDNHPSYRIRTEGRIREVYDSITGSVKYRAIKN